MRNKLWNKVIAVALALTMIVPMNIRIFKDNIINAAETVQFSSKDEFSELVDFIVEVEEGRDIRVLQLTDPQIIDQTQSRDNPKGDAVSLAKEMNQRCFDYIRETVENTRPDLILVTGDLIYGKFDDNGSALQALIQCMESFKIPWAPIYGNHDNESKKGVDWQCEQLEKAQYCLFKQRTLTGNGNYTVGISQGGKLKRVFFMLDTNGCGAASQESLDNGHTKTSIGFGQDQIDWYTNTAKAIRKINVNTKISFAYHIQNYAFKDAYAKYGFTNSNTKKNPINIDEMPNKSEGDFGYIGKDLASPWDQSGEVWNGIKELGTDSVFVGHEHCISASVVYDGIRFQFGQKTGNYDTLNYLTSTGKIVSTNDYNIGVPLVGGSVIPISQHDGNIVNPYIYYCNVVTKAKSIMQSYVVNGTFETGDDKYWTLDSEKLALSTDEHISGKYSLKLDSQGQNTNCMAQNTIMNLEPDTTYEFSYYVKINDYKGPICVNMYEFSSSWGDTISHSTKCIVDSATNGEWVKKTYEFTSGANTSILQIRLSFAGGEVYCDNVSVVKQGMKENLLANGDFTTNSGNMDFSHWSNLEAGHMSETADKDVVYQWDFENGTPAGWSNITVADNVYHNGGHSAKANNEKTLFAADGGTFKKLDAGNEWVISAWVYSEKDAIVSWWVPMWHGSYSNREKDSEKERTTINVEAGKWTLLEHKISAGDVAIIAEPRISTADGSQVYIDDVSVYKASYKYELAKDGVIANGPKGEYVLAMGNSSDIFNDSLTNLVAGSIYEYSFWIKTENAGADFEFSPYVDFGGNVVKLSGNLKVNSDWNKYSGTFVAQRVSNGEKIKLGFERKGTGVAYVMAVEVSATDVVEETTTKPEETTTKPEETTTKPEETTTKPEETTTKPEETTTKPEETTTKPEETTIKPEETTTKLEETTTKVPETTKAPEITTKVEETTTAKKVQPTTTKKPLDKTKITKKPSKKLSSKKVKVSFRKVKKAKKYTIQFSVTKKFKKVLYTKTVKSTKVTISNSKLKNKKKLYVRVRAVGAKKWSSVVTIKVKK